MFIPAKQALEFLELLPDVRCRLRHKRRIHHSLIVRSFGVEWRVNSVCLAQSFVEVSGKFIWSLGHTGHFRHIVGSSGSSSDTREEGLSIPLQGSPTFLSVMVPIWLNFGRSRSCPLRRVQRPHRCSSS